MTAKQKLELVWIGKENRPRLEPRILLEDSNLSYHAARRLTPRDHFDNRLIFGDNLLALKALEQEFAGKIKCIYIDPPYNTGSAFEHYDDGVEHSLWLSLMRDRVSLLWRLLSLDGSVWINIDDNEGHYLKVLMDEIFGRANFVGNVIWQKRYSPSSDALGLSESHDHILVYARSKKDWKPNRIPRSEASGAAYKNPDADSRGLWRADNYKCNKTADERPNLYYAIRQPNNGKEIWPKRTAVWRYNEETHLRNEREGRVWWGKDGLNDVPAFKRFLKDVEDGVVAQTIWTWQEVGHNQDAKREQQALNPDDPFSTPKPERLLERIVAIATNPNDAVLDSFAGSGTTGAVAHKMGRRWIMVELGEHCHTHIIPRLRKVIDGDDPGGITDSVGWKGGGGFRYFKLAPSLLKKDQWGNLVVNKEYNAGMLAEAMCKLEGFTYAPSDTVFWQHGYSTERDFIYVTTQKLTREQLEALSDEVGDDRSLLVCCSAFRTRSGVFPNLTVKKIPNAVLARCEWGHDDYSLQIRNLPAASNLLPEDELPPDRRKGKRTSAAGSLPLFDTGGDR